MNLRTMFVSALVLSAAAGCSTSSKSDGTGSSKTSRSTAAATTTQSSGSAAGGSGVKGSSGGPGLGGASVGGAHVAGEVVIKTHELPAPTRPVADFTPAKSGFAFQNYGNDDGITNLTVTEARRMFGDLVCGSLEGDRCILTPPAEQWLESSNKSMGGGHCEGFAALALLMERGQIDPKLFGAATVAELELEGNDKLQREIAYWFVTQAVMPMGQAEDKTLSPGQVVDKLAASIKGGEETYTLGIYGPGYTMGHATTPYAVVEKENDVVWIMHYDNNYPGQEKHIEVDRKANTWTYTTAADPAAAEHAYKGDAETKTLTLAPTSVRTGKLECHFCGSVDAPAAEQKGHKGAAGGTCEIALEGNADLLISTQDGKRLGYADGKLVQEIDGAVAATSKSGHEDEPIYYLPCGQALHVALDGSALASESVSDVSLIGRGYTLAVEGVSLSPGQKDEIDFAADWSRVTYTTKGNETPTLVIGIATTGADYELEVKVSGEAAGQAVELSIDLAKGTFGVTTKGDAAAKLSVTLTKIDDSGEQIFRHEGLAAGAHQAVSFGYAAWKGDKSPLHMTVTDDKGAVVSEQDATDEE